ncbi:MAG TPA: sugar kinase [Steroidobacteraceae bacterium]|jgi:2-dehydro-3-deoxygluconokinase|nr:sugar kinase [Steroidobacteraceae bacterium]
MSATVLCFGEILLRLSSPNKELLLQSARFDVHVGGAEANVAVSLSKFGHAAAIVSTLPDSPLGHACAGELRRHDVRTDTLRFTDGRMGLYFLTHGAGQRPAEVLYDRAGSAFAAASASSYDWSKLLEGCNWLHVSGITPAVSDAAGEAAARAMAAARQRGTKISFDCNFRARVWGARSVNAPAVLRGLCEQADLIFGDERDFAFMLGGTADAAFESFRNLQWIACTNRERQSMDVQQIAGRLRSRRDTYTTRPYPLYGIVDRIGAGDAFAAGVLHGLIAGFDPQKTIDFATAAAVLKHSIPGDFQLGSVADVERVLSEQQTDVRR